MLDPIAAFLLLGLFFLLIFFRVRIAFAMSLATLITTLYLDISIMVVAQNMVSGVNVFSFLAIPFFILTGEIMSSGGISKRLIAFSNALVGWFRGGLAMVNVLASMFFGGISGSPTADVSSIGAVMIPMMKEDGYDGEFATTVTLASSIQGLLVPPSHNMVIYSLVAGGVSIANLFLAGLIPGVLLGVVLMIFCYFVSKKRDYPVSDSFKLKRVFSTGWEAILGMGTVFIVVFGVITGVFTATESAAIAALYSFFITFFVYRDVTLKEFPKMLEKSLQTLSLVMALIASAGAFGWMVGFLGIPGAITNFVLSLSDNPIFILLGVNFTMLLMGTMVGMAPLIIILTPILLPIVTEIGMHPVHFGVVMVFNLGLGLITPPVGGVLFIGSAIAELPIERVSKFLIPFYLVMLATLLVITFIPQISMLLPTLFGM